MTAAGTDLTADERDEDLTPEELATCSHPLRHRGTYTPIGAGGVPVAHCRRCEADLGPVVR